MAARLHDASELPRPVRLPGCGPGGRGFESRRSPSGASLQAQGFRLEADRPVPRRGQKRGPLSRQLPPGSTSNPGGDEPPLRLRGDELDLYGEFHAELWRTIRATVRAPIETIDDACSFAWMQFLRDQPDRDASWRGWLVTTAQREAWRLNAIEWRDRDFSHNEFLSNRQVDPRDRYDGADRFDAALQQLKKLPPELQRVVLIRSQVWKQEEVAEVMGIRPEQVTELLRAAAVQVAEINQERSRPRATGGVTARCASARARAASAGVAEQGRSAPARRGRSRRRRSSSRGVERRWRSMTTGVPPALRIRARRSASHRGAGRPAGLRRRRAGDHPRSGRT